MTSPFLTLIPFFALVLIGFVSAKRHLVTAEGAKGLNAFVFYFALPALLFDKTQAAPVDKLVAERAYILAYLAGGLAVFALGWIGARLLFRVGPGRAALLGLAGVYGNIGFMGIPVLSVTLGDWVAVPLALIVLVDVAILIPIATIIIDTTREPELRRNLPAALATSIIKNPVVLATLAGLGVAWMQWTLPAPLHTFTDLLGRSAGPAAMFTLGAVLALRPLGEGFGEAIYASVFKLAIYPAAVWVSMTLFAISPDWRLAATFGAAMPMATVLFVLAGQYRVMPERASTAVLLSTVLSMATVTALSVWTGGAP